MNALKVDVSEPAQFTTKYRFIQTLVNPSREPITIPVSLYYDGFYSTISQNGLVHVASTSAQNEAESLSRLYSNIKSTYENFNSLNFLGEMRETLRMLRSPASALATNAGRFLDTVKSTREEVRSRVRPRKSDTPQNLRRRRANAVKDAVSGSWLEFAFGWTPLANDVKGIAETAARALVGASPTYRVTASSRVGPLQGPLSDPVEVQVNTGDPINRMRLQTQYLSSASVKKIALLKATRSGPAQSLDQLAVLSGFAVENFIPTAYQLAPWSFLIDYFLNLGDVLEAWFTDTSSVFAFSSTLRQQTEFRFTEAYFQFDDKYRGPGGYIPGLVVGREISRRVLTRTTLTRASGSGPPMPPLVAKIPGIDSSKWINIAALAAQAKAFRFSTR
jgi:hypothetical protein